MKNISPFRFKQFSVWHHRSAMKVGVDGVLIACWADVSNAVRILDVGTGCGLIALIMAQRQPDARISAIEIDDASAHEARQNFNESPWHERIRLVHGAFPLDLKCASDNEKYDLIVSNPPFFNSGLTEVSSPRERARHQGELSPASLLIESLTLLNPEGSVAMIVPAEFSSDLEKLADSLGYFLAKKCLVRGHSKAPFKRVLLQWKLITDLPCLEEQITLEISPGIPTEDYRDLCRDFYLKF